MITICSDTEKDFAQDTEELTAFDDSMYYELNRIAHEKRASDFKFKGRGGGLCSPVGGKYPGAGIY